MFDWLKKWIQRKALYPIILTLIIAVNNAIGGFLTEEQIAMIAATVVAFILGESYVDAKAVGSPKSKDDE
jgi:hypothetical protein